MLSNKKIMAYAVEGLKQSIGFTASALWKMRRNGFDKNAVNEVEEALEEMRQDYYEFTGKKWED